MDSDDFPPTVSGHSVGSSGDSIWDRSASDINNHFFSISESIISKRLSVIGRDDEESPNASCSLNCFPRTRKGGEQEERLSRRTAGSAPVVYKQIGTQKLVVAMVGLPGRGKTYTARRIMRYFTWLGVRCKVFNASIYRRKMLGFTRASFFDHSNTENLLKRETVARETISDMLRWMEEGGKVAIYDATNTTRSRREYLSKRLEEAGMGLQLLFLEISCQDETMAEQILRDSVIEMPEYQGMDLDSAVDDFRQRIKKYEATYEPLSKDEGCSFICQDRGRRKLHLHRVEGYLPGKLSFLLMNLHVKNKQIYVSRLATVRDETTHKLLENLPESPQQTILTPDGSSSSPIPISGQERHEEQEAIEQSAHLRSTLLEMPVNEKPEADAFLSEEGARFAKGLVRLLQSTVPKGEEVTVWTSSDPEGAATAQYLEEAGYPVVSWRYLGQFSFSVVQKLMGESDDELVMRLEPILFELERCSTNLLIIGHNRVVQALYSYLAEMKGFPTFPNHVVTKFSTGAYRVKTEVFSLSKEECDLGPFERHVEEGVPCYGFVSPVLFPEVSRESTTNS